MQTGLFIPGGWARDPVWGGKNCAGWPSTRWGSPFFFRFPIADRHTAYEWAMVLADVHPYAGIASLFGSEADLKEKTIAGMHGRERAIEGVSEQANGIYRELSAQFEGGRLEPLRREWCTDRPGIDRPYVLDFTRCVFALDQVLRLIRRRGDTGRLIGKLLAASRARQRK
jgi:hypothetical protein